MLRRYWIIHLLLLLTFSATALNQHIIDSLNQVYGSADHDTTKALTLSLLAEELKYSNLDTAIHLSKEALEIYQALDHKKGIANSFSAIGNYYRNKSEYELAIENIQKAIAIQEAINDTRGLSASLNNLGIAYDFKGDYDKALQYYFKALRMREALQDSIEIASALSNVAIIYYFQENYDQSIDYNTKALNLRRELNDKKGVATSLNNIGVIYMDQKKHDSALDNFIKSLNIRREIGDKAGISHSIGNIGMIYREKDQYDEALKYYKESMQMMDELSNRQGVAQLLNTIAQWNYQREEYEVSIEYGLKSLVLSREIGAKDDIKQAYKNLRHTYEAMKDFKNAYKYMRRYSGIKDSLFNEAKSKELGKLEAQHEFETAEAERKRAKEARLTALAEEQGRRNNLQYSGILIFLIMLGTALVGLGRLSISVKLAEGLIFFTFLLFFEFTLVLLDPYIEAFSSGAPALKLGFNALLAAMIFPLHAFFEERVKQRIVR
ncbi:MAG: tetratricopeptide repeat protein [Flavobacteriales bacterium]|nr:tetratricopeptide repeat protein [Flavobacteriales bacterium]